MKTTVIIFVILTIIMLATQVYKPLQIKKISNNLIMLVTKKKYDELYESLESEKEKKYIPDFNRFYLGMNAGILQNNNEKATQYFDLLLNCNLKEAENKTVFMRGLQYFVAMADKKRCKICCEELQKLEMDSDTKKYLDRINDVMILDKVDSLNELLDEIKDDNSPEVFANEFLISTIYKNLGNEDKEKQYQKLAQDHLNSFIELSSKTANQQ